MNTSCRLLLLLGMITCIRCGDQFQSIPPGQVTIGEIEYPSADGGKKKSRFMYSVPNAYAPGKSFPFVIALHGGGDNMAAFHDLWKSATDSLGFVLLTPQGDIPGPQNFGWTWGADGERAVLICRDIVRKAVHVEDQRTYVAGFSAGGRLSHSLGVKYPHLFTGFAALSVRFDTTLATRLPSPFGGARAFIGHGSLESSGSHETKTAVGRLRDTGFKVKYVQYEGIGHALPEPAREELKRILNYLDSGNYPDYSLKP